MIKHFIIISILFCQCFKLSAQFFDDFSDADLGSNPNWSGDVDDFRVNDDEVLQLDADDGSTSFLYTSTSFSDSIQWDFEVELAFSPSANNRLRVYLAIDDLDLELASGYFIEIGENGANDALHFYSLDNGGTELLGSGSIAALSEDPAFVKVSVIRFPSGEWTVSTAYERNVPLTEELFFMHSAHDFGGDQFFQLECNYTASRTDKFFFDNVGVKKYEVDKTGPTVLSATLVDSKTIDLQTDERIDPAVTTMLELYSIVDFGGEISNAELFNNETGVRLNLSEELASGRAYTLRVNGLIDINGNKGSPQEYQVFVIDEAEPGDLVVNEILFNPETGGSDFVEILNVSEKFIRLGTLQIANLDKEEFEAITSDEILLPGQHLCLSEDVEYLKDRYDTPDTARFLSNDLPSFNNDNGNVAVLHAQSQEVIDSYDYSEEQHFQELDDVNGVSLERLSPSDDKWFSATSTVGYATPGYRNSVFVQTSSPGEEILSFENKTFSPNQDGIDDQLIIKYNFPQNGYQVDIFIFDQYGREIRQLVNNELFPEQGFVIWDGLKEGGEQADIGVYFIVMEGFDVRGDVISARKAAILADYLN